MSSDDVTGELRFRGESERSTKSLPEPDPRQLQFLLEQLQRQLEGMGGRSPAGDQNAHSEPQQIPNQPESGQNTAKTAGDQPISAKTFGELAAEWHRLRAKTLVEPRNEERHIRHLAPLHGLREAELLPRKVEEVLVSLLRENGGKLSPSTVAKVRVTGMQVVASAIKNRAWREKNPFELADRIKVHKPATWDTLSLDEARAMLSQFRRPRWRKAVTMLLIGLRPGEMQALRKEDVDLARGRIIIRRSKERNTTKTGRNRVVAIPAQLAPVLQEAIRLSPCDNVFPDLYGDMRPTDRRASKVLRAALARAGCPRPEFTWYGLRHTCATLLREAGCDPLVIKITLGHTVNNPTDDIYSHLSSAYQKRELEKLSLMEAGGQPPDPDGCKKELAATEFVHHDASTSTEESKMASAEFDPEVGRPLAAVAQVVEHELPNVRYQGADSSSGSLDLLTVPETASLLRLSVRSLREFIAKGKIPYARVGKKILFRRGDLGSFVEKSMEVAP
jgi:excisionase family DNA binding protein